jgi:uncharacterized RDD family membrane protein YckC
VPKHNDQPICKSCIEEVNRMRAAKGYPSLPVPADAYDPAEASAPTGKTQETSGRNVGPSGGDEFRRQPHGGKRESSMTLEPAGFWRRWAACVIDELIFGFFLMLPFIALLGPAWILQHIGPYFAFILLCYIAYYVLFLSSIYQATPGKWLMSVYIVSAEDQGRLSPARALGRFAVFTGPGIVMLFIFPFFAGQLLSGNSPEEARAIFASPIFRDIRRVSGLYVLLLAATIAFTREKTGIHDLICKTRAVMGDARAYKHTQSPWAKS